MKTNYGEEYNRESMYETAREYFLDGKKVQINGKKCKYLIDVMLEDFRLEIDKEHDLLKQSEIELTSKNEMAFLDKFSQTISRGKTTDYLQKRLEEGIKEVKKNTLMNKSAIEKHKGIKKLKNLSLEELSNLLTDLESQKQRVINSALNGDCVNTLTYKLYLSITNLINKIKDEINERKSLVDIGKEQ